jgi:hypothetical protein
VDIHINILDQNDNNPIFVPSEALWNTTTLYSGGIWSHAHPIPWRESILRPIDPVSSVAGGDDATRPRRQDIF